MKQNTQLNQPKVVIIDTGCANLSSVKFALERLGVKPIISAEKEVIASADKVLLPGVGSANNAMQKIKQLDLLDFIPKLTMPVLGICLGMQLLAKLSQESSADQDYTSTLGIIDAEVEKLKTNNLPLPHMGWNTIKFCQNFSQNYSQSSEKSVAVNPLFKDIADNSYFYFVHSFAYPNLAKQQKYAMASCNYGSDFIAVIAHKNFYGVQFHPERSGAAGAKILANFIFNI